MKRKDIIIISVLVNAGLLALLFVTAVKLDPDAEVAFGETSASTTQVVQIPERSFSLNEVAKVEEEFSFTTPAQDEVDHVLKEYLPEISVEPILVQAEPVKNEPIIERPAKDPEPINPKETVVEVRVKSGDALEKIARANQTTVDAIRKANKLTSDKLKIGQVLKVPVGKSVSKETASKAKAKPVESHEIIYYTIKNGDNPWKIAKSYQVKFEDLLKLNDLNEEKAKNLKAGDKIRVR